MTWADRLEAVAVTLVLFPALIILTAASGFFAGFPMQSWYPLVAVAACAGFLTMRFPRAGKEALVAGVTALLLILLGVGWAALFVDTSFDGNNYHQGGVISLARGWNPWMEPAIETYFKWTIWVEHWSKGAWINGAAAEMLTHRIDSGKWMNVTLTVASALAAAAVLLRATQAPFRRVVVLAFLIAVNPVVLCQINTFYVDGLVASMFTVVMVGLWSVIVQRRRPSWWLLIPALLLLLNVKQTGVAYGAMACAIAVIVQFVLAGWRRALSLGVPLLVTGLVGMGYLGFSPYGKNLLEGRHVFHPLLGAEQLGVIVDMGPRRPENLPKNRLGAFVAAQFARAEKPLHESPPARWKFPLMAERDELLLPWITPDVKMGGFGPWYGSLFLVSFGGVVALWMRHRRRGWIALVLLAGITSSVCLIPECWWPRYAPQAWLLVWVACAAALDLPGIAWRWWRRAMFALGLINCVLIGVASLHAHAVLSIAYRERLDQAARQAPVEVYTGSFPALAERFKERDISFVILSEPISDGRPRHRIIEWFDEAYWVSVKPDAP